MENLATKAVLVQLSVGRPRGGKRDKASEKKLTKEAKCEDGVVAVIAQIIPKDLMKRVENAEYRLRKIHNSMSLPWATGGLRIMLATNLPDYEARVEEAETYFRATAEEFLMVYNNYRGSPEAIIRMGELKVEFPSTEAVRREFYCKRRVLPLPDVEDFRMSLSPKIQAQMKASFDSITKEAVDSIWKTFADMVGRIYKQTSKAKGKIYGNLFSSLREFCESLSTLNITNDPRIEEMRKECLEKLAFDPEDIKDRPAARKNAASAAKHLLESIRKINLEID